MDYLQYINSIADWNFTFQLCFKPYYKWITFNTPIMWVDDSKSELGVLNLIINGLPSILSKDIPQEDGSVKF